LTAREHLRFLLRSDVDHNLPVAQAVVQTRACAHGRQDLDPMIGLYGDQAGRQVGVMAGGCGHGVESVVQFTGINRTVTLRVERFNYSGNLTAAVTYVYRGPGPNGPWTKVAEIDSRGSATRYVDFTVNNGDWVYYYAYGDTSSGRRWGQWDIAFWNESVGHVSLTGGRLTLTVDNDDNYNVADYSLNHMDFGNIWFDTYDGGYYTYNDYQSVSGINQPVTVAVQIANYSVSGPIRDSVMACQTQRGDILTTQLYNGTSYVTVYNGDSIRFAVVLNTTGGRRSFGFDAYLYNQNTGDFIDHFNVSGYFGA